MAKKPNLSIITICLLFFGFFVFGIFLFLGSKFDILNAFNYNNLISPVHYNQKKDVLAAEEKPVICRKQTEVRLPVILGIEIKAEMGPNEFEIPTGQVTDRAENLSKGTSDQLSGIIKAAEQEIIEAKEMINLASQCGITRCATPGCNEYDCNPHNCNPYKCGATTCYEICWDTCCNIPPCSGQACPDNINSQLQKITAQKDIISEKLDRTKDIVSAKPNKPVGYWWLIGCHSNIKIPPVSGCLSEIDFILAELERARSGDYEIVGGWERRPPGLAGCVVPPKDIEALLKGEITGKYLLSCKEALMAGFMGFDKNGNSECYGYNEVQRPDQAENYYCCE